MGLLARTRHCGHQLTDSLPPIRQVGGVTELVIYEKEGILTSPRVMLHGCVTCVFEGGNTVDAHKHTHLGHIHQSATEERQYFLASDRWHQSPCHSRLQPSTTFKDVELQPTESPCVKVE